MERPVRIGILLSAVDSIGGMQRFNRLFLKAANSYVQQSGGEVLALTLQERDSWFDPEFTPAPIPGCGDDRRLFVARSSRLLSRRLDAVIAGHVGFAPIVGASQVIAPRRSWGVLCHGVEVWRPLPMYKRFSLQHATVTIPVSNYTMHQLVEQQGVRQDKTVVLPNCVDPSFSEAVHLPIAPSRPTIVSTARLDSDDGRYKGIDTMIAALPGVLAQVPDAELVIVGEGDDMPRLQRLAHENGVTHAVQFRGRVTDAELRDTLRAASLFVLPSRGEGFGMVFLEAMSFGVPVIGGAHGGSVDAIVHGETGFLVQHGDTEGLASYVTQILTDRELHAAMAKAGRRRVLENFTYPAFEPQAHALFDQLVRC